MIYPNLIINSKNWNHINQIWIKKRLPHAFLFHGPKGSGKEGHAMELAALLNCREVDGIPCGDCPSCKKTKSFQNENIKLILPLPRGKISSSSDPTIKAFKTEKDLNDYLSLLKEKSQDPYYNIQVPNANTILINSILEIKHDVSLSTVNNEWKIILIFQAEKLCIPSPVAAHSLLKILEEPPNNTTIILVTDYKEQLSPTLLSRCQHIDFPPIDQSTMRSYFVDIGIESELIPILTEISQGDMHKVYSLFGKSKEEILGMMGEIVSLVFSEKASSWRHFINEYSRLAYTNPTEFRFRVYLLQLWIWSIYKEKSGVRKNSFYFGKSIPNCIPVTGPWGA